MVQKTIAFALLVTLAAMMVMEIEAGPTKRCQKYRNYMTERLDKKMKGSFNKVELLLMECTHNTRNEIEPEQEFKENCQIYLDHMTNAVKKEMKDLLNSIDIVWYYSKCFNKKHKLFLTEKILH